MAHELNGEVINDTLVQSIRNTEERFNVDISGVYFDSSKTTGRTDCSKYIMAGDDVFDFATIQDLGAAQLSIDGLLVNVYDIPHLNLDMPWWQDNLVETMTFMDQMYIFSNSLNLQSIGSTFVMFFNKDIIETYGIEDPYQTVFDGQWTLDYFISIVKDTYKDIDGDGTRSDKDLYGFAHNGAFYAYLDAFNVETMKKDGDKLVLNANTERVISLVEKHYDLFFNTQGARFIHGGKTGVNDRATLFSNGQLMFTYNGLSKAVDTYRYTEIDYGIVPMPKYNENEDYCASCNVRPCFVPITNDDLEATGIIIESMSAEGYRNNFPAYYDVALKDKFLYDEESVRMLDMIYDKCILSFSYLYEKYPGYSQVFSTLFNTDTPNKNFASYYASNEEAALSRIAEIEKAFTEMADR